MNNEIKGIIKEEIKGIIKEDVKEAINSGYAQGIRDGVLLVVKTYDIELGEAFEEKLEELVKNMSLK